MTLHGRFPGGEECRMFNSSPTLQLMGHEDRGSVERLVAKYVERLFSEIWYYREFCKSLNALIEVSIF